MYLHLKYVYIGYIYTDYYIHICDPSACNQSRLAFLQRTGMQKIIEGVTMYLFCSFDVIQPFILWFIWLCWNLF